MNAKNDKLTPAPLEISRVTVRSGVRAGDTNTIRGAVFTTTVHGYTQDMCR